MATTYLEFENSIRELDEKIRHARTQVGDADINAQLEKLRESTDKILEKVYSNLSTWDIVQVARHPDRPHTLDYIETVFDSFEELHGDRRVSNDEAVIGGLADFYGQPVMVIGHEKGRETEDKIRRNFGMPQPGGLRKAGRLMSLAAKFKVPVISFIDTPGAYPGVEGEEQGQSEAIASNLALMSHLPTPLISVVVGEGGSGGALALGVGDKLALLEYSIFSVATPEACASIIWRDAAKAETAATAMKVNSSALKELGIIDDVIPEPTGGAHRDPMQTAKSVENYIGEQLEKLVKVPSDELVADRYDRIMNFGRSAGS